MKKVIGVGLLAGLVMVVVGIIINLVMNMFLPVLNEAYRTSGIFRPWSDPRMMLFFVCPFLSGLLLTWVWSKVKDLVKGVTTGQKGLTYGFIYWLTSWPGMLITYSSFNVSLAMVMSWTIPGLIEGVIAGVVIAKMMK
jgi:hypothetical protein